MLEGLASAVGITVGEDVVVVDIFPVGVEVDRKTGSVLSSSCVALFCNSANAFGVNPPAAVFS